MKKKLFLFIVVLAVAAVLISGCSTDQLKERIPGVKANVNLLLADNEEGDLEYEVGEVKTEEDFTDANEDSFGTQIIDDIEAEIAGITESKTIKSGEDDYPPNEGGTIESSTSIDLTSVDQTENLEEIVFSEGKLIVEIDDTNNELTLESLAIDGISAEVIDSNTAELQLVEGLDLTKNSIEINYVISVTDYNNLGDININLSFNSVGIKNIDVNLNNFDWNSSDYNLSMNETLIENYEKEEFIESLEVVDSEMYINFDIAEGINLDLSNVYVKSDPEITEYTFPLADEDLTSENSRAVLDLNKIVLMLQDDNTTDVNIAGDIALSSDGVITITRASELKVKNAVLQSAELKIDNYQMDPEAAEEGLTSEEVNDIKKGLEEVEVIVEGISNPLPAEVDLKVYVKDGAGTKSELFQAENKLTTFNLKANTTNGEEVMVINKDQYDKFIGNDLYIGLELYSDFTFTKEEYDQKVVSFDQIKAKFNINVNADDFE